MTYKDKPERLLSEWEAASDWVALGSLAAVTHDVRILPGCPSKNKAKCPRADFGTFEFTPEKTLKGKVPHKPLLCRADETSKPVPDAPVKSARVYGRGEACLVWFDVSKHIDLNLTCALNYSNNKEAQGKETRIAEWSLSNDMGTSFTQDTREFQLPASHYKIRSDLSMDTQTGLLTVRGEMKDRTGRLVARSSHTSHGRGWFERPAHLVLTTLTEDRTLFETVVWDCRLSEVKRKQKTF